MKKLCFVFFVFILFSKVSFGQINAVNDNFPSINSSLGDTNAGNVLYNNWNGPDMLNGNQATLSQVAISVVAGATPFSAGAPVPQVNPTTGVVSVPAGTPASTYIITYQICEIAVPTNCDTALVIVEVIDASIDVTSDGTFVDSNGNGIANPGDIVTYFIVVTNTGSVPLTNVTITDNNALVTGGPILSLAVGASNSTTFSAVHVVTQADINAGYVYNYATATGTPPNGPPVTGSSSDPTPCVSCPMFPPCTQCTITPIPQNPSINVTMDGFFSDANGDGIISVGDKTFYDFIVTNTGNVPLTNVTISCNNSITTGDPIFLNVGASNNTAFHSEHIITAMDILNGQVDNMAMVTGIPPVGPPVTDESNDPTPCASCTPLLPNNPNVTIVKFLFSLAVNANHVDSNSDGSINAGENLNYSYTLRNFDTTALTNLSVYSNNVTVSGGPLAVLPPLDTNSSTFTGSHTITQAEINLGRFTTRASAIANGTLMGMAIKDFTLSNNGIRMIAFIDTNLNGIQDTGEISPNFGNCTYQINGGSIQTIYSSYGIQTLYESNPATVYNLGYNLGSYSLYYTAPSYSNVTVANGSGITIYKFALQPIPYTDLAISIYPVNQPRPGFLYYNTVTIRNNGNQMIPSGTATFTKDNALTIDSLSANATPTANGFTLTFTNLAPNQSISVPVTLFVPVIPTVSLGQMVSNLASVTVPPGDILPLNNNYNLTQTIVGAYDPNDKTEAHGGRILHSSFTANDYLTYTIRFENTGTASAEKVRVDDILDAKLDENSIEMIATSHNYVLRRTANNLSWEFDAINLPPSNGSATVGHGFITFQIKPKPGYAIGDVIPNSANIYFDFNPAIVTPVCNTEFVATMGTVDFAFSGLKYYPNPVQNVLTISNATLMERIEINSILGLQILSKKVNALETEVDLSSLSNGIYFVKINSEGQEKTIKIIRE